jgi:hypothetical protein
MDELSKEIDTLEATAVAREDESPEALRIRQLRRFVLK